VKELFEQFDAEMERRGLDTVLVVGESTLGNPELAYVTRTTIPRGGESSSNVEGMIPF